MDKNSNYSYGREDSNPKDSGSDKVLQGNYPEPVKKPTSNNLIRCDICSCEMSSTLVLNSHINGSRHKKKMKALEIVANLRALGQKGINVGSEISTNCYRCDVCCLTVNSPQQLEIHLSGDGSKHKSKIAKEKSLKFATITNMKPVPVSAYIPPLDNDESPPSKRKKMNEQNLACNVCNIGVNSEIQYEQHVYSKKHLSRSKGDTILKPSTASENETILLRNSTPGNPFSESKEPVRDDYQDEASVNAFQSGNANNIIQVHSQDHHFNQCKNECGNCVPIFSNYKPIPRHLVHHRQDGVQFGGVGLYEAGKFFAKARPHVYHSNDSAVQTSPSS